MSRELSSVPDQSDPDENIELCANCNGDGCPECDHEGQVDLRARSLERLEDRNWLRRGGDQE